MINNSIPKKSQKATMVLLSLHSSCFTKKYFYIEYILNNTNCTRKLNSKQSTKVLSLFNQKKEVYIILYKMSISIMSDRYIQNSSKNNSLLYMMTINTLISNLKW